MFSPDAFMQEFEALSKLLNVESDDSSNKDHGCNPAAAAGATTTAAEADRTTTLRRDQPAAAPPPVSAAAAAAHEDEDALLMARDDGRVVPACEVVHRQSVTAQDAFLGLSGKQPSSAACEELAVSVKLPGVATAAELDLDLKPTRMRLTSAKYKLLVYLPRKVVVSRGRARWDAGKCELRVTAPVDPEEMPAGLA